MTRRHAVLPIAAVAVVVTLLLLAGRDAGEDRGASIVRDESAPVSSPVLRGTPRGAAGSALSENSPGTGPAAAGRAPGTSSTLPPFDVTVLDGETGQFLDAAWAVLETAASHYVAQVLVQPPAGYVAWDRVCWTPKQGRAAKRFVAVVPLRREVPVWVTVRRADGRRLARATLSWRVEWGEAHEVFLAEEVTRLSGVPHFRGSRLRLRAEDGTACGTAEAVVVAGWDERLEAGIVLEEPDPERVEDEEIEDHVEHDNDLPYEESLGDRAPSTASVTARLLRRDGAPAVNVEVHLDGMPRRTDGGGRAQFRKLEAGDHVLRVRAVGVVPFARTVRLGPGEDAAVELQEPEGATVEVEVVDEDGRGRPFARLQVYQQSYVYWTDVEGGVQRIDRFTDERGRRRLGHVEPGRIRVVAWWGGRYKCEVLAAREGETLALRIVIP